MSYAKDLDGNLAALDRYLNDQDRYEASLPTCDECGNPMQEYYQFDTDKLCEDCMEEYIDKFRRVVE
jgi:hypothetical protein